VGQIEDVMPRPKHEHPTPGELEVLRILWERSPLSVREVMETLNRRRPRAYTSVMSLLNVMTDKGLLSRKAQGRAFVYAAKVPRQRTMRRMLGDLLGRAFEGSAELMVAHLLQEANPSAEELAAIRETIAEYERQHKSGS
jgi:predicted transcriptional regulator